MKRNDRLAASKKQTEALLRKVGYVGGKGSVHKVPDYSTPVANLAPLSNTVTYSSKSKKREANVYDGERVLLGIATMHKSNMVPVFSKADATDIAKMRRG
jgi:hypothetical protein|tara:strand:+ start:161 stop:460 length:300 start_codon:yes stop_codon:yes gene_type:complete